MTVRKRKPAAKQAKKKGKTGTARKPYKLTEEMPEIAQRLCAKYGATGDDLAEILGVSPRTVDTWMATHPEFAAKVDDGKKVADDAVEQSLYSLAIGDKHAAIPVPGNVTACIFWLKNRRRQEWRDRHDLEHSGKVGLEQLVTASMTESAA